MKKYIIAVTALIGLHSCSNIEEKINQTIEKTTTTVTETAQNAVKETLNETVSNSINSMTNAENAQFQEIFPNGEPAMITDFTGKKFTFPNGAPAYIFKYKSERELLIPFLEQQETTDETKSDKAVEKINGQSFIDKLSFIEKFIPANTIDMSFLDNIKNDKSIEYYKLKRYPNSSTLIYNPKTKQVFHFVEVARVKI